MNAQELEIALNELLGRDVEEVRAWESAEFDKQAGSASSALVLFGAGGFGRNTLKCLRQLPIEPLAFADNNATIQGQSVDGLQVLSPHEAAAKFKDDAVFVVTIWGGHSPDRMNARVEFLKSLGCRRVVSFYPLLCKHAPIFLPHYACDLPHRVYQDKAAVLAAGALWSDEASRREYSGQLKWRAQMDFSFFPDPVKHEIYFPDDVCALTKNETFVDCGAFDGDTLRSFLRVSSGDFERAFAFEPDPQNFARLEKWLNSQPAQVAQKIHIAPVATGAKNETLRFSADGTEASAIGKSGSLEVEAVALDEFLADARISYLKMDIEGAELQTIHGAANLIRKNRPVLAVCVYHQQDHIWSIPNFLNSICDDYCFYLRPHLLEGWDTVLYAVPVERITRRT